MTQVTRAIARPARSPRLATPLLTGAVVATGTVAVALRDPHVPGAWGTCPWLAVTGTYCPGCGGLRAVHDLVHLHVADALSSNAFVVLFGAVLVVGWVVWLTAAVRRRPLDLSRWVTPWMAYGLIVALLAFSVVRNLPFAAWLAPDLVS